tara:strand:- start:23 stop:472 length:450 start_codon:yes stop_codon:yes gene_type:complete
MNLVNKTMSMSGLKNLKTLEIFFVLIMFVYLVSNMSTPYNLAPYVNNVFTYGSILALAVLLHLYSAPVVTLLFVVTALVLVYRSRQVDHNIIKPSEVNKNRALNDFNANKNVSTLEEEMVDKMVKKPDNIPNPQTYHPVLCSSHGATEI